MFTSSLERAIKLARLDLKPSQLILYSVICGALGFLLGFLLLKSIIVSALLGLLFCLLVLFYPFGAIRSRRTAIDVILPHAIAYMQSLCGVMNLYEIFKEIFEQKEIYKELSEEFGLIVRDVELLGYSVIDAMRFLANNTASKTLKDFLEGLVIAFESGSDLKGYMAKKIDLIRDRAKKQMEMNMRTLEIVAEVFVVLFVALPIFLAITLTTMKILGTNLSRVVYIYIYLFIPLGGLAILYLVDVMNVKEDLGVVKAPRGVVKFGEEKRPSPIDMLKTNYYYAIPLGLPLVLLVLILIKIIKFKYSFESDLCLLVVSALLPLSIAFEYRAKFVRRIDKELPEFLRQILNLKDVGLTLHGIIRMIRESEIGVISRELRKVEQFLEFGSTLKEAFIEFVNRVGVSSIRRAIFLLIRASEATENLRDVLLTAIDDFEYGLRMRDLRFATGFSYVVIIYMSFYIFLYTAYVLVHTFMAKLGVRGVGFIEPMYRMSIIVAIFSGLLAGEMEGGHILYGLKHVFVFLISSLIVFEFLIG